MDSQLLLERPTVASWTMLVPAGPEGHDESRAVSKLRVLKMVGRRGFPSVIEATIIPSVLFYVFLVSINASAAMLAALVWTYGSALRRIVAGRRIPGLLMLAVAGVTMRTIVGLMSGTFLYFLQPIATTVALALVFLGSLLFERPMIARMASDFCPLDAEITGRPAVVRLFSGLTLLWACVHLLSAVTMYTLLVSLPTTTFVALKTPVSLSITITAIVFTVAWSIRTARSENLIFAPA
jgi:intracellular septation protein A